MPDDKPAIVTMTKSGHPAFDQYVGQQATVTNAFGDPNRIAVTARFADGKTLCLRPDEYTLVEGKLRLAQRAYTNKHPRQDLRQVQAGHRYHKRAMRGGTVKY